MSRKRPFYKIECNDGRTHLFMYEYSNKKIDNDRNINEVAHYSYFKEQVLSSIKRDYDDINFSIIRMKLSTISYMEYFIYNTFCKVDDMITIIPAKRPTTKERIIKEKVLSQRISTLDPVEILNKQFEYRPTIISLIAVNMATSKDDLEELAKSGIIYNGSIVAYMNENKPVDLYVYNNDKFILMDKSINLSDILDECGYLSYDKT